LRIRDKMVTCPKCSKDFEGNVCPYCGYSLSASPTFVQPIETPQPSYYQPQQYVCLLCGGSLTFVKEYAQWYCPRCKKYASEMHVSTPPQPAPRKLSFGEKITGFLGNPTNAFNNVKPERFADCVKYYGVLLVMYGILATTIFMATGIAMETVVRTTGGTVIGEGVGVNDYVTTLVFSIVIGVLGLFIGGAWLHLWIYILGGRKGYTNTVKAIAYGATPALLFGWIPCIGFIGSIWGLVLNVIGISQLQEISTGRSAAAFILAVVSVIITIIIVYTRTSWLMMTGV